MARSNIPPPGMENHQYNATHDNDSNALARLKAEREAAKSYLNQDVKPYINKGTFNRMVDNIFDNFDTNADVEKKNKEQIIKDLADTVIANLKNDKNVKPTFPFTLHDGTQIDHDADTRMKKCLVCFCVPKAWIFSKEEIWAYVINDSFCSKLKDLTDAQLHTLAGSLIGERNEE